MPTKPIVKSSTCCGQGKFIAWAAFVFSTFALAGAIVMVAEKTSCSATPQIPPNLSKASTVKSVSTGASSDLMEMKLKLDDLSEIVNQAGLKRHFSADGIGLSFDYPASWGKLEFEERPGDSGSTFLIGKMESTPVWVCGSSVDFSAARGSYVCDASNFSSSVNTKLKPKMSQVGGAKVAFFNEAQTKDLEAGPETVYFANSAYAYIDLSKSSAGYKVAVMVFDMKKVDQAQVDTVLKSIKVK